VECADAMVSGYPFADINVMKREMKMSVTAW
jgi:hypothetical protein